MLTIFRKAMWDQRRSLFAWGSGLAAMILLESAMWPSLRSMGSLEAYLQDFPEPLRELFNIEEMTTGRGFLNAELFTLMLPMLFLVFGITRGARMVAGEEEAGSLDLLLVTPLSTTRLLLGEALALVAAVSVLASTTLLVTVGSSAVFGLGISVTAAASGGLALALLGTEFGCLALVAGALTGRRGAAMAVASALALTAYVLFVGGVFVEGLSGLRAWSPFHQVLHTGPLAGGLPVSFVWPALVAVLVVLAALPVWARRDVGAAR